MHICLVNLPRFELHRPPLGIAILSEICEQEKVDYGCIDLSLLIWKLMPDDYSDIDTYWTADIIDDDVKQRLSAFFDKIAKNAIDRHPDTMFCLSLLSYMSQSAADLFCTSIKKFSNCEILIGGQGVTGEDFTNKMLEKKLIDHFIVGEGEITFRKFLQGARTGPGINNHNFEQVDDVDRFCVVPNYSKLPLDDYPYINQPELNITASRGCVRDCGYCDVGHYWKKYRYRSAENVAKEMISQFERHGITEFSFTDSLINGSMKMLNELCDMLIEYRRRRPDANFKWRGQYIFRPIGQVKEEQIRKLAEAGCDYLIIGLETGSDRVRFDMNKKHTTKDAEWYLEMFKKYGIQCRFLMLTGWVTETIEDQQATLDLFPRWQKYVASQTITGIELGSMLVVLENAPVGHRSEELGIMFHSDKQYNWVSSLNPDLDLFERVRRRVEVHKEAIKYKWPITRSLYRLDTIRRQLVESFDHVKSNNIVPAKSPKKVIPIVSQ